MKLKNSCNIGEIGEAAFMLEAVRRGFIVSQPFGHAQKYDFIVDTGTKLLKVQIKACTWGKNKKQDRLAFNLNPRGKKLKSVTGRFDVLVGYDVENKDFYTILAKKIIGTTVSFSSKTKPYKEYKNNWSIFDTL